MVAAAGQRPGGLVLDGELVVEDTAAGRLSFQDECCGAGFGGVVPSTLGAVDRGPARLPSHVAGTAPVGSIHGRCAQIVKRERRS